MSLSLSGVVELRPQTRGRYRRVEQLMVPAYVVLGLVGAVLLRSIGEDGGAMAFFGGAMALMVVGWVAQTVTRRRTRIVIVGDELHYVGVSSTKVLARRGQGKAVALRLTLSAFGRGIYQEQRAFLDEDGTAVHPRIIALTWDVEALDRMCDQLQVPRFVEPEPLTPQQVVDRYEPGIAASMSRASSRPRLMVLILGSAVLLTLLRYLA